MRKALIPFILVFLLSGGALGSPRGVPDHPAVREVLLMMKGGVAYEVMVERVKRMEDVPALDAGALAALRSEDVPDKVLLELVRRKQSVAPCPLPAHAGGLRAVLADASIRELLEGIDDGTPTNELVERVGHMPSVPVLDARALNKLTGVGVPDRVLLELVRKQEIRTGCDPARAELLAALDDHETKLVAMPAIATQRASRQVEPATRVEQQRGDPAVESPPGTGWVRVIAKSSLPVTYLEVQLDGEPVTHQGKVPQGETQPGWMLARPPVVNVKRGLAVFETELPAGTHEVQTEFALAKIVETNWDPVVEAYGQRYETTTAGPMDEDGEVPVCEIQPGETCVVLAHLVKRGKQYVVEYEWKTHQARSSKKVTRQQSG